MPVEHYRLVLLALDVDDLFALGDRGQRLVDDAQRFQRLRGCVQLSDAAIDQHQARHVLLFFLNPLVTAGYHLAHRGEVVHPDDVLNDELAVVGFLYLAVFPDHHRRDGFRALDMGDVEALNPLGQLRQHERVLQGFLDRFRRRLHDAEALIIRLLGILAHQVDQRALVAALRYVNLYPPLLAFREHFLQRDAIFEVHRNIYRVRHILLVQVDLLQQRRKEFSRLEARSAGHTAEVFPEELALVHDLAATHVEEIHRQHLVFVVIAEDIGIVALDGGDALLLVQQLDGRDEIAILRRQFILLALGCGCHTLLQGPREIGAPAFEDHPHVVYRFGVALGRGKAFNARPQAAPDVVLQARSRIAAIQVEFARGNQKVPVDQVDDSIGQARWKIRPEVERY